jgi:hypothetical protein
LLLAVNKRVVFTDKHKKYYHLNGKSKYLKMASKRKQVKGEQVAVEVVRKSELQEIKSLIEALMEMRENGISLTVDNLRGHPAFCNAERKQESMVHLLALQQLFM